jgi:hypothetical protein
MAVGVLAAEVIVRDVPRLPSLVQERAIAVLAVLSISSDVSPRR